MDKDIDGMRFVSRDINQGYCRRDKDIFLLQLFITRSRNNLQVAYPSVELVTSYINPS